MDNINLEQLKNTIKESDYVLVGIGKEISNKDKNELKIVFDKLKDFLSNSNYFIVWTDNNSLIREFSFNEKRIVCPKVTGELEEKQWDFYNRWLASSLAKSIAIVELGEGFDNPNIIKWPFERVTMISNKARLIRVNANFSQVPAEISEKCYSIPQDSYTFLKEFML